MSTPIFKFALRDDLKGEKQFLPVKAHNTDVGYDVRSAQEDRKPIIIKPMEYFKIPLGFRSFCPENWYYQLHPRSSSFIKKSMHNLIGIIDECWEGFTLFAGQYIPDNSNKTLIIEFGERIGQLIVCERKNALIAEINNKEYDDICFKRKGDRQSGGFGSTG